MLAQFVVHLKAIFLCSSLPLTHRWQTEGRRAESGPPPCCIRPSTLFLPQGQRRALAYLLRSKLHVHSPKLHSAFEGNHKADVAPGENEFDTPDTIKDKNGTPV